MQIKRLLRRLLLARFLPARPLRTLSSSDAYEKWAATYPPRAHNALMRAEEAAILALLPPVKGQVVLDLASGTGRYGLIAWERGALRVIAADNSSAMLRANPLPRRVLADVGALPLRAKTVDVVVCGLALGHTADVEPAMKEIGRVLRWGGWAVVSDFHPILFLSGARRTFQVGSKTYAVEHHAHLYSDYHRAAKAAGLTVEAVEEPRLDEQPELPVVIVYRLRKA